MGYASTDVIVYGVPVSEEIAEKLYQRFVGKEFLDDNEEQENPNFTGDFYIPNTEHLFYFRKLYEGDKHTQQEPITPYKQHSTGGINSHIFYPTLISEGTDSRIDNLIFDSGYQHYFGIYVASKGYGYYDEIKSFIRKTPQEAIDNFNQAILPILKEYHVDIEPDTHIVNQTW